MQTRLPDPCRNRRYFVRVMFRIGTMHLDRLIRSDTIIPGRTKKRFIRIFQHNSNRQNRLTFFGNKEEKHGNRLFFYRYGSDLP